MEPMFIKRKILCNSKTDNICLSCNQPENICKGIHCHLSAAAAIATEFRICKIGRVEEVLIKHINIQMDENMVKTFYKFGDFIGADKAVHLNFVVDPHVIQKSFLIIMKALQSDIQYVIWMKAALIPLTTSVFP